MRTSDRVVSCLILVLGLTLGATSNAAAKCCALKYVIVSDVRGADIRIEASELDGRLEDWEMQLLSWPVFNGMAKGHEVPDGRLGRGYLVTYVHDAGDYEGEVSVRERVYPFAKPHPVAFTLKGQTQDWIKEDDRVYRVEWGWRPVQEGIISALFESPSDAAERTSDGPPSAPWPLVSVGLLIAFGGTVLVMRHRSGDSQL